MSEALHEMNTNSMLPPAGGYSNSRKAFAEPLDPWLAEFVEQKADDIARLITERVESKLQEEERRRLLEAGRLRLPLHDGTAIKSLPLPTRLLNALQRAGVETLGDLEGISETNLRRWRNIGESSLEHLQKFLTLAGRSLRPEWDDSRSHDGGAYAK